MVFIPLSHSEQGVCNHWTGMWNGTMEWKMEWNGRCIYTTTGNWHCSIKVELAMCLGLHRGCRSKSSVASIFPCLVSWCHGQKWAPVTQGHPETSYRTMHGGLVYQARLSLTLQVRESLADVISMHEMLTNQILLFHSETEATPWLQYVRSILVQL